jgi:hypothetical protein
MPKKTTAPCSRVPVYPTTAFAGLITLTPTGGRAAVYPLSRLYTAQSDFIGDALNHQETIATPDVAIGDVGFIIPLTFDRLWELKEEYWTDPTVHFGHMDRAHLFTAAILTPDFFSMLVTPNGYTKGKDILSAAMPVPASRTDSVVEQFMRSSDFPVDEEAKYAAVYTIGSPVGINIKTGELVHPLPLVQTVRAN